MIGKSELKASILVLAFIITTLYGLSDEIYQISVPERTFQVIDICLDALGGAIGVSLYFLWYQKFQTVLTKDLIMPI